MQEPSDRDDLSGIVHNKPPFDRVSKGAGDQFRLVLFRSVVHREAVLDTPTKVRHLFFSNFVDSSFSYRPTETLTQRRRKEWRIHFLELSALRFMTIPRSISSTTIGAFAAFCFFSGSRADFLTSRTRKVRGLFQYGLLHDAQNTGSLGNLGCHAWPQRLQVSVGNTTVISIVFLTLTAR
jgi:hypothetical protein